jgi:hypothetical protein
MTKKWPGLFLVQSSIPLSQGWLDLRSVKNLADRRTKAAPPQLPRRFLPPSFRPQPMVPRPQRPSERRLRQEEQRRRRCEIILVISVIGI